MEEVLVQEQLLLKQGPPLEQALLCGLPRLVHNNLPVTTNQPELKVEILVAIHVLQETAVPDTPVRQILTTGQAIIPVVQPTLLLQIPARHKVLGMGTALTSGQLIREVQTILARRQLTTTLVRNALILHRLPHDLRKVLVPERVTVPISGLPTLVVPPIHAPRLPTAAVPHHNALILHLLTILPEAAALLRIHLFQRLQEVRQAVQVPAPEAVREEVLQDVNN